MSDEQRLTRIIEMEKTAEATQKLVNEAQDLLQRWDALLPQIKQLTGYYQSNDWREDYDADNRGEIPTNIQRGILSEDWLYNLLTEYDEICREYQTLITDKYVT